MPEIPAFGRNYDEFHQVSEPQPGLDPTFNPFDNDGFPSEDSPFTNTFPQQTGFGEGAGMAPAFDGGAPASFGGAPFGNGGGAQPASETRASSPYSRKIGRRPATDSTRRPPDRHTAVQATEQPVS